MFPFVLLVGLVLIPVKAEPLPASVLTRQLFVRQHRRLLAAESEEREGRCSRQRVALAVRRGSPAAAEDLARVSLFVILSLRVSLR